MFSLIFKVFRRVRAAGTVSTLSTVYARFAPFPPHVWLCQSSSMAAPPAAAGRGARSCKHKAISDHYLPPQKRPHRCRACEKCRNSRRTARPAGISHLAPGRPQRFALVPSDHLFMATMFATNHLVLPLDGPEPYVAGDRFTTHRQGRDERRYPGRGDSRSGGLLHATAVAGASRGRR